MAEHWALEDIVWDKPARIPDNQSFVGREELLRDCMAAWGVGPEPDYQLLEDGSRPLHFRLEGPPGVGKNELVYELARRLDRPLYMIAGHEEMTPEDLALLIVPEGRTEKHFALHASPLATAIRQGGLFFFDEINRVPERALSPLASVLDDRQEITSVMTNIAIRPESDEARKNFRFCCALNPRLSDSGYVLPDYIEQRTLPVFAVENPGIEDLLKILSGRLGCDKRWLAAFQKLYERLHADDKLTKKISVR